jgi:hypothetical protein
MKKRTLAQIKAEKGKRALKRSGHSLDHRAHDPKDLRGAKGALLKSAGETALQEEPTDLKDIGQRHLPLRIRSDW